MSCRRLIQAMSLSVPTSSRKAKLNGGALYIAIIVSILIGIILCMFILMSGYNQRNVSAYAQSVQLGYNLKSAFELAQSAYFNEGRNNKWFKNSTNDDSIKINKKQWGAYLLIDAQTKNRHRQLSLSGLYGTCMTGDTGLIISDNSRPIGISGAVVFKANCYLPHAGIKPAYIEGQSYQGSSQNAAFIKTSPQQIQAPDNSLLSDMQQEQSQLNVGDDSLVNELPQVYANSFSGKTVVWEFNGSKMAAHTLKNNIKIIGNELVIDSTCHLDNVLIICNKIRFSEGFKGKVHVIARDSITASINCRFNYPSSFVLLPESNGTSVLNYIQFNAGCRFFGGILALNKSEANTNGQKVFIKLNATSEINGFVYSSDYLHLEGKVNATAIANKLLLKTPSAVYENHLLACDIDPKKYAYLLAVPLVFKQQGKLMCCQKMN